VANFDQKHLKALKKQLTNKQKAEKEQAEAVVQQKQREILDKDYFREAMTGVNPLSNSNTVHNTEKPKAKRLQYDSSDEEYQINDPLSDELEVTHVDPAEILNFCADGIQKNVFKKLRSGGYRISDELDLHGSSIKQAKQILVYYLQEAVQFEGCCIRIVHGKGHRSADKKPILKTHVNHWLIEHDRVLAFHSTKPRDGGTGAVYVLLKR
jgi:DNA-nicking Smr family endonuclease